MKKKHSNASRILGPLIIILCLVICPITTRPLLAQDAQGKVSEASETGGEKKSSQKLPELKLLATQHFIDISGNLFTGDRLGWLLLALWGLSLPSFIYGDRA